MQRELVTLAETASAGKSLTQVIKHTLILKNAIHHTQSSTLVNDYLLVLFFFLSSLFVLFFIVGFMNLI